MNQKEKRFEFQIPVLKAREVVTKDEAGNDIKKRFVEGIASSTDKDLHGDRMSPSAIETMADSIKRNTIKLNDNHDRGWSSELGEVTDLNVSDNYDLFLKGELDETSKANDLWYALTTKKAKLGLSIGGYVKGYEIVSEENDDGGIDYIKEYTDIELDHVAVTSTPANPKTWVSVISKSIDAQELLKKIELIKNDDNDNKDDIEKAKWDTKFVNNLPDAAFAAIKPGGKKDDSGKTVPRSLRALPHHNANVKNGNENNTVDKPHLRNAMARVDQTDLSPAQKSSAKAHLDRHAKALGIGQPAKKNSDMIRVEQVDALKTVIKLMSEKDSSYINIFKEVDYTILAELVKNIFNESNQETLIDLIERSHMAESPLETEDIKKEESEEETSDDTSVKQENGEESTVNSEETEETSTDEEVDSEEESTETEEEEVSDESDEEDSEDSEEEDKEEGTEKANKPKEGDSCELPFGKGTGVIVNGKCVAKKSVQSEEPKDGDKCMMSDGKTPGHIKGGKCQMDNKQASVSEDTDVTKTIIDLVKKVSEGQSQLLDKISVLEEKVANIEDQPASRKVAIDKGLGDDTESSEIKEDVEKKIEDLKKNNPNDPNMFAKIQRLRRGLSIE